MRTFASLRSRKTALVAFVVLCLGGPVLPAQSAPVTPRAVP
jgi:hypothetical protein